MIYPLLPLFLTSVLAAGPATLGAIEGLAESTASLVKLGAGLRSDRVRRRKPIIVFGYALAALVRPLVALASSAGLVAAIRFTDRVGKGLRGAPRDALIADSVDPALRGRAFGLQRSMDHAGALIGPLVAAALLASGRFELRTVFALAAVPGLLGVALLVWRVREPVRELAGPAAIGPAASRRLGALPRGPLRRYLVVLLLFTLGNSSDAFLLLRAAELGLAPAHLPLLWAFFHLVKAAGALPLGAWSDRVDRRRLIIAGWAVYALVYLGFARASAAWHVWALFAAYGLYYALTEGVEKALLVDLAPAHARGGAFGWHAFVLGAGALPASLLFGALWQAWGPLAAFGAGAALAAVAAMLLWVLVPRGAMQGSAAA
ncbi:MAG: MFS transporter [bacterium]|nr:MFS transporter [bacterium]